MSSPSSDELSVLFVRQPEPSTGDLRIEDQLKWLGFTVTSKSHVGGARGSKRSADQRVTEDDAFGKSLVLISSTVEADVLGDEFSETPVPVVVLDAPLCEEMSMTYASDEGVVPTGSIDIIYPGHPLAADFVGHVRVSYKGMKIIYGRPGARALKIASLPESPNRTIIFAYEGGEEMIETLIAPARRVGFALNDQIIAEAVVDKEVNDNVWALFDAAVFWAVGLIDKPQPKTFLELFIEECGEIRDRRYRQRQIIMRRHEGGHTEEEAYGTEENRRPPENLVGLALSGGGIRSATFSLGVLQGLKTTGLLYLFDYLSTVSGGGYFGGWWSAWLAREMNTEEEETDPTFPPPEKVAPARSNLSAWSRSAHAMAAKADESGEQGTEGSDYAGTDPVHHLRLFSNYLTPRKGTLSADTWRAVSVVTRNLVMTWLILVPILFAAVVAGQLYFIVQTNESDNFAHSPPPPPAATAPADRELNLQASVTNDSDISWKGTISPQPAPEAPGIVHQYSNASVLRSRALRAALPIIALTIWIIVMICIWMLTNTTGDLLLGVAGGTATWLLIGLAIGLGSPATVKALLPPFDAWNEPGNWLNNSVHLIYLSITFFLVLIGIALALRAWWLSRQEDHKPRGLGARWKRLAERRPRRKKTGRRTRLDVLRNRIIRTHASLLVALVVIALVLAIAGFGHEIAEFIFEAGGGYVKKVGGVAAILTSIALTIWTAVKSAPSGGSDAQAGRMSIKYRVLLAVTPPLAMLVLAIALAWGSHMLLSYIAGGGAGYLLPLDIAIFVSIILASVFAAAEINWRKEGPWWWRRPHIWTFIFLLAAIALAAGLYLRGGRIPLFAWSFSGAVTLAALTLLVILLRVVALQRRVEEVDDRLINSPFRDFIVTRPFVALLLLLLFGSCVVSIWVLDLYLPAIRSLSPAGNLMLASASFSGLLFCLIITVFEIFRARGQSQLPYWLIFANSILLTAVLLLSFFDNPHPIAALNLTHAVVGLLTLALGWVIALGWLADPNALSLHSFYKARLVRAYMGASNPVRRDQKAEITEAVRGDDVSLKDLNNCHRGAPYHLINTTLNLIGGRDLSTAQRSSAQFLLSKRFCGSTRTLYRRTSEYMDGELTLGTGVAISGAAASPNMGALRTTAAQAMLLTLLNVRLGYWAPTPNREQWRAARARLWPFYMLREFLSQTNDLGNYCYLTDGGHFDNLGLYALVERGCRFIVASDATADPKPCFSDLGDAIRRCRIDFGAEIDLNVEAMKRDEQSKEAATFVVGTITYASEHVEALGWKDAEDEARRRGIIILIKPAMTEGVNADVRQYSLENDSFPDQTTGDQFFDEAQFESYRKLGQFCAEQAFRQIAMEASNEKFDALLKRIRYDQYLSRDEEKELARLLQFRKIVNLCRRETSAAPLSGSHMPGRWDDQSAPDYRDIETVFLFLKELAEEGKKNGSAKEPSSSP
jgi:hypothetical protein